MLFKFPVFCCLLQHHHFPLQLLLPLLLQQREVETSDGGGSERVSIFGERNVVDGFRPETLLDGEERDELLKTGRHLHGENDASVRGA